MAQFKKGHIPWIKGKKGIMTGSKNGMWKGGKCFSSHGYILVNTGAYKNEYEHKIIMEKYLGRKLKKGEEIHHIDKNKKNNAIKNLIIVNSKEHKRIHNGWILIGELWYKKCPRCKKKLSLEDNFYKRADGYYFFACKKCANHKRITEENNKIKEENANTTT